MSDIGRNRFLIKKQLLSRSECIDARGCRYRSIFSKII